MSEGKWARTKAASVTALDRFGLLGCAMVVVGLLILWRAHGSWKLAGIGPVFVGLVVVFVYLSIRPQP